ncbi:MAG: hypothetical protein IJK81_04240 [Selenomonadaceae bacterium]|nr:hypothetical protein [Selenomonadaceae bacterium]
MKELLLLPLEIIFEILESIIEAGVDACPPLLIFLLAVCLFMNSGCLSTLGGIFLVIIGIIALIVWLII